MVQISANIWLRGVVSGGAEGKVATYTISEVQAES